MKPFPASNKVVPPALVLEPFTVMLAGYCADTTTTAGNEVAVQVPIFNFNL